MRVKEVQTENGYWAVNAESILGIVRGQYTVWRGFASSRDVVLTTRTWDCRGERTDVTTRLPVERELREVEVALDSAQQDSGGYGDVLRGIIALCNDALSGYDGLPRPFLPEALRRYSDIRFIAQEALEE